MMDTQLSEPAPKFVWNHGIGEPPDTLWASYRTGDGRDAGKRYEYSALASSEMYEALRKERSRVDDILSRHLDGYTYNQIFSEIENVMWHA